MQYGKVKAVFLEKDNAVVVVLSGKDTSRKAIDEIISSLGDHYAGRLLGVRHGDGLIFCGADGEELVKMARKSNWYKSSVKELKDVRTNYRTMSDIHLELEDRLEVTTDEEDTTEVEVVEEGILCGNCRKFHAFKEDVKRCFGAPATEEKTTGPDTDYVKLHKVPCKGWDKVDRDDGSGKHYMRACPNSTEMTKAQLRAQGMKNWYCPIHGGDA